MKQGLLQRQQATKERKAQQRKNKPMNGNGLPANYQKQVDQLSAMAMSIIYDNKTKIEDAQIPQALQDSQQKIKQPDDAVASAVADVSLWVLSSVEDGVKARGQRILPIVVLGTIGKIVAEVSELTQVAGLAQMTEEDVQISIATALNKYIPQARKEGKVTDRQLKEAAAALQQKYPEEAQAFRDMVKARAQRHAQELNGSPSPLQEKPQGLLGGVNG